MEEYQINVEKGETEEKVNFEPIIIEQNGIQYVLNLEVNGDKITFFINDKEQFLSINYLRTMSFNEIKKLNDNFNILNSFNDFYEHLKQLSNTIKIFIMHFISFSYQYSINIILDKNNLIF